MNIDHKARQELAIAWLTGQATQAQADAYAELMATDPQFEALVNEIETWLSPLNVETEDLQPPAGVYEKIMAAIDGHDAEQSEQTGSVSPMNAQNSPANDRVVRRWKTLAITSALIAAISAGSHLFTINAPAPVEISPDETPALLALLSDSEQPPLVAIVYNPQTLKVVARFSNVSVPNEKELELWLIREGGEGPISLGVLSGAQESGQVEFNLTEALQAGTDTLAVSLEAPGGSGSAAGPKGPILYTGAVSEL